MTLRHIGRWIRSEEAATAAEYAFLLALILLALVGAATTVGNSTSGIWQGDVNRITSATGGS